MTRISSALALRRGFLHLWVGLCLGTGAIVLRLLIASASVWKCTADVSPLQAHARDRSGDHGEQDIQATVSN